VTNPLFSKRHPRHFLYTALGDLFLALLAGCVWLDVIRLDYGYWTVIPSWVWPGLTGLLFLSAVYAYSRYRDVQAKAGR
jgi:hypothetical protein